MAKIKVKCNNVPCNVTKVTLLEVLSVFNVKISSVEQDNNIFIIRCNDELELDKFFTDQCIASLEQITCAPLLPPQLKAKRTIFLRRLDKIISDQPAEQIEAELMRANNEIRVTELYKFPNNNLVKVTLATQTMAIRATEKGLYAFNLSIPPDNISIDKYIDVEVCFKCYQLNSHSISNCEKDRDYVICSICASTDHSYKNCQSTVKKCINCDGEHSTLAFSCPVRKKIVAEKRKLISQSYANAANSVPNLTRGTRSTVNFDNVKDDMVSMGTRFPDVVSRATMCLLVASLKEAENKGVFQSVLDELLAENGLSKFNMGTISPPLLSSKQIYTDSGSAYGASQIIFPDGDLPVAVDVPGHSKAPVGDRFPSVAPSSKTPIPKASIVNKSQCMAPSAVSTQKSIQIPKVSMTNEIVIHKKRGVTGITASTIENLLKDKKIYIESNMNKTDYMRLLKLDIGIAKIVELPIQKFNAKLNSSSGIVNSAERAPIQQVSN